MIAALALAAACVTQEPKTPAGALAAERRWVAAIKARDVATLACLLDAGFADTDWRGQRIDRATVLANLPHRPDSTLALDQLEARVIGDVAIVRGRNRQAGPDGKRIDAVRFTDAFVWRAGAWHALSAQETVIADPE